MFSEKIRSVVETLGKVAGETPENSYWLVSEARQNLAAIAEHIEAAEKSGVIPTSEAVNG